MSVVTLQKNSEDCLLAARDVMRQEAQAILAKADALGADFEQAMDLILNTKGRLIITGMGKSGHIGAKLAATFASTGTPSFFVHPGEASHGDLGMISEDDVVMALSHSGGTRELGDVLAYCNRFDVPLIAITGKTESLLGKAATVVLLDDVDQEACPLNLAPTTSTSVTLAMGDALAVACMHHRGFKEEDFARYHPGGKLGSRLSRVNEIMLTNNQLPIAKITDKMDAVVLEMTGKNLGSVGIVDDAGILKGIITDGDFKRHLDSEIFTKTAADVMTANPKTIEGDVMATAAVQLMQDNNITALFVKDETGCPTGYLQIHHCLQAGVI